jgi:phage tail-like protein
MAEFSVNPARLDPYKGTKFRVKWDGKYVPGVFRISGLIWNTQVVTYREGGSLNTFIVAPGQTTFEPIVLTRGRTHDTAFEDWANKVWSHGAGGGAEVSLNEMRKDILIELHNEAGQAVMGFIAYRCWPSRYEALGPLDAIETALAVESLTLHYEGFDRDTSIVEPKQP